MLTIQHILLLLAKLLKVKMAMKEINIYIYIKVGNIIINVRFSLQVSYAGKYLSLKQLYLL